MMVRAVAAGLAGSVVIAGAARAAIYVDQSLPDLKPEELAAVANPGPVQLLFQFKTKGAANARATKAVKPKVIEAVKASGLFTEVSDAPQPNGAILSISIDDTGDTAAAARSGFVTGLTFGLKGSAVADNYEAVADYVPSPGAAKLTKVAHHRLITTIGLTDAPPNMDKAANTNEAVFTMVRQVVSHDLNDLAKDPAFAPAAPAPVQAAPEAPAAPAADAPPAAPTVAPVAAQ
jgi:hypothetical protein